jgi:hypothetical protein
VSWLSTNTKESSGRRNPHGSPKNIPKISECLTAVEVSEIPDISLSKNDILLEIQRKCGYSNMLKY